MSPWLLIAGITASLAQDDALLIETGASWRYTRIAPAGPGWTQLGYDDSAWLGGEAQIGFGEEDQERELGTDPNNPLIALWLRRDFQVVEPVDELVLELLVDDGAIVWLNGTELYRQNMPPGPADETTLAASDIDGHDEHRFTTVRLPPDALVGGANQLAVEVHQSSPDSDDLSFDLALTGTDGRLRVLRGPYLQQTTPRSTTIRWRTDDAVTGRVWIGTSPDALDREVSGPFGFDHEVTVTDLAPETRYFYAIGSDASVLEGDETHTFTTAPPAGEARPTRIWVIGDSGTADASAALVRDSYASFTTGVPTDLWLMLGDNAYGDGTDAQYQGAVFDMYPDLLKTSPVWPTLGNHDGHTAEADGMIGPYFDIFTLPMQAEAGGIPSGTEAYYAFDWSNIHFVVLDSYSSQLAPGSPQWIWLEEDLLSTDADWIVAYWHHPPYSKGTHDSDTDLNHILMRQIALPILEDHGVDLVLSGHSHGYERSMLIDGHYTFSADFTDEMVVDGGLGRPGEGGAYTKPRLGATPHQGAVYVVNGSSGQIGSGSYDHPVHVVSWSTLGSLILDVEGDRLHATFLSGIGETLDTFTIVKGDCPAKDPDTDANGVCDSKEGARAKKGCGCDGGAGGAGPIALLLAILALRRRTGALALLGLAGSAWAHPTLEARLERIETALVDAPCDGSLWQKRARILVDEGRLRDALDGLDTAVLCDPTDPRLAAARGAVRLKAGDPGALEDLEFAAAMGVSFSADLARAYDRDGACDRAAVAWEAHLLASPQPTPDAAVSWARSLRCDGRTEEAIDGLGLAIEQIGAVPALERERIELLAESGRVDEAVSRIDAIARGHRAPVTWLELKERILRDAGRPDEAQDAHRERDRVVAALPERIRERG